MKKLTFLSFFILFFISTYGQWYQLNSPEEDDVYIDVGFFDELNGYLISTWEFYKTDNGGMTWTYIPIPDARSRLNDIFIMEEDILWISTDDNAPGSFHNGGTILKSVDGGTTWEVKFDTEWYGPKEIFFLDGYHGWVTTDWEQVFRTIDGGETWLESEELPTYEIRGVHFVDENTGWICGGTVSMLIFKSTDGGLTWEQQFEEYPFSGGLWDIEFIDDQKGFACSGDRTLLMTEDGGENWEYLASSEFEGVLIGLPSDYAIYDIEFIDQNRGWIAGGCP